MAGDVLHILDSPSEECQARKHQNKNKLSRLVHYYRNETEIAKFEYLAIKVGTILISENGYRSKSASDRYYVESTNA